MSAIAMKAKLSELAAQHGISAPHPTIIPLAEPIACSELILEGIICAPVPSLDRSMFAKGALTWPRNCSDVPLYMRHDVTRPIGTIKSLAYDADGNLKISATVTDAKAMRMGGFSVGATATEWTIRNETSRDFFAEITKGAICEISITDRPADSRALVLRRYKPGPFDAFMTKLGAYAASQLEQIDMQRRAVDKSLEIVEALREISGATSRAPTMELKAAAPRIYGPLPSRDEHSNLKALAAAPPHIYGRMPARPRLKTEFRQLTETLSERGEV